VPLPLDASLRYAAAVRIRSDIEVPDGQLVEVCRRYDVALLELFGSSSRGDFRPDSDVDLLVEFLPGARVGFLHLARLQLDLEELIGRKVDLVPRAGLKAVIRDDILREARALFAA
jgi:hypothetical protein